MTDITGTPASGLAPLPPPQPHPKSLIAMLRQDSFFLSVFLCLLLLGGDIIAIRLGGLTLRIVFPLLMTAFGFLYLRQGKTIAFDPVLARLFMVLAIVGAASAINSYDVPKSVGYTIWVLFDFFVIISLCYNFAKAYSPDRVLSLWFLVYRIHVVLLFCEIASLVATGASHRAHLWFYEPSYLAIFMTGYFGSALYMFLNKGKRYSLDFALSLIGMLATTSATGIFGMIFAVLVNFALAKQRVTLLLASVAIAAFILGVLYLFFRHTPYYDLIAGFFFNQDFSFRIIVDRGGNRWIRTIAGWDAFQHHPWLGVGIGGDSAYMQVQPFSDYAWQFMNTWSGVDQIGMPFCNIVVEVLGTMGIAGFIPFAGILIYAILQVVRLLRGIPHPFTPAAMAFFMGFFTIFLALQFDGTFLRYYLWSPLGLALGAFAQIRNAQNGAAPPSPP